MKKFVCPVCGYVLEAETMPEGFVCPVCKVPGSKFKVMEEGKRLPSTSWASTRRPLPTTPTSPPRTRHISWSS